MIDAQKLLEQLRSDDPTVKKAAIDAFRNLTLSDRNEVIALGRTKDGLSALHTLLTGVEKPVIDPNIKLPSMFRTKEEPKQTKEPVRKKYGIYTVGDYNFFPGIVASINALRYYGCTAPIGVIDIGFEEWMADYLSSFENVQVLSIDKLKRTLRFTDELTDEPPVMKGWAYKAFGIVHYDLFDEWTFIDADFLPLCNLEDELKPLIRMGLFVSTEDGVNDWGTKHRDAIGVKPGKYMNINAGFISLDMEKYGHIIHEWRNLMTRKKPFELWYGDQGALNAVLDKYAVEKYVALHKRLWNQTWLNAELAQKNVIEVRGDQLFDKEMGQRVMAWHGMGWHKLWHQIGIDHYRKDKNDRNAFYQESQGKSPKPVVEMFSRFLFMGEFNKPLRQVSHLIRVK